MSKIKTMFNPKAIALIGATEDKSNVGGAIMENLLLSKDRKIYPVNPACESIMGLKSYPEITGIADHIELAVVATPAESLPSIVEQCGEAGVDGLIIVSGGFKESGGKKEKIEQELIDIRKRYGMRITGPNCAGIIRPNIGLNASSLKVNPKPGNIAFISQSGPLGGAILDWAINARIGFSMFAALGSMIDIDFGDLIDFLGDDYQTRSIILYMEAVGNARKFMSAARGFARNKPIIVVKPGRFSESAQAMLSQVDFTAGHDHVYDAAFKRVGVIRVKEVSDLFNTAAVLDSKYLPKGRDLAIVTNTDGFGIMAADALIELGGRLAELSEKSLDALNGFLPPFRRKSNPVDLPEEADAESYTKALKVCLDDPHVDGVLAIYGPHPAAQSDLLPGSVAGAARNANKPVIAAWIGGEHAQKGRDILLGNNVPTYETPEDAVKTYLYMYKYRRNLDLLYETPSEIPLDEAPPKNHLKAFIRRVLREGRVLLTEEESKGFIKNYGIPVVASNTVPDVESAVNAAGRIGYPVVIRVVSPDIAHKSDVGGIKLGIKSDGELREEYVRLLNRVKERVPDARITGVSVRKMLEDIDYEIIVGAKKYKDFGSVLFFGMGGSASEILKDTCIGLPPLNQTLARRLMEETAVYRMLQGHGGKTAADMKQLEQILVSFSNLIVDFPEIWEIDINPLAVSAGKAYAVDTRVVIDRGSIDYPAGQHYYPHLVITPYPARYAMAWRLSDGTEITLRPIRPEDEPMEFEMLSTLSEETMRARFFSIVKDITHDMLIRFCNIDYDREMAIVAELKQKDKKRIIGIGRLIIEPDHNRGEYAVLVHDEYHGKGLGYKLVDMLIGVAQDKGLDSIYGVVLSKNDKMLRVARKLGFTVRALPDGISRVELEMK